VLFIASMSGVVALSANTDFSVTSRSFCERPGARRSRT
jgi:hypothetical protein